MPLNARRQPHLSVGQRDAVVRALNERARTLREEIDADLRADLNAEPEAAALERDEVELREVEAALARVHEPGFGLCTDCDVEIPFARLEANPAALRCVACQARAEQA